VFQAFASALDEAGAALAQAGDFLGLHFAADPGDVLGEPITAGSTAR
jgi:hypothetical protein